MSIFRHHAVAALIIAGGLLSLSAGAQSPAGAKEVDEFKRLDASGNGYLSGTEITSCSCAKYDADADGRITFLEFAKGRGVSWAGGVTPAAQPQPAAAAPAASSTSALRIGEAVEIKSYSKWYKGRILSMDGAGIRVHYDDFSEAFDEVVAPDRVRRPGTLPPPSKLAAGKVGLNGFYLRIARLQGGRQSHEHYRFWPDGRVCKQIPTGGADAVTFESMQRTYPDDCGRYAVQGESITFDLAGEGKPYTVNFRQYDGTNFEMNLMPTVRVRSYAAGARLNGTYEGIHFPSPLRADRYVFRPDGTYSFDDRSLGAEDSGPPTNVSGSYQLGGNTIVLSSQVGAKRYTVYQLDEKGTLVIESTTLTRK